MERDLKGIWIQIKVTYENQWRRHRMVCVGRDL